MTETRTWAYVSMLTGGIVILVGGLASGLMMLFAGAMMPYGMMGDLDGWPVGVAQGWVTGVAWWMLGFSVLTGAMVLYAAVRYRRNADATTAGTLAIVGGALSLLAMGGWLLGAVLAVVGGALALGSGRPTSPGPPVG